MLLSILCKPCSGWVVLVQITNKLREKLLPSAFTTTAKEASLKKTAGTKTQRLYSGHRKPALLQIVTEEMCQLKHSQEKRAIHYARNSMLTRTRIYLICRHPLTDR